MIALLQRVSRASVQVAGDEIGRIDAGLLVLVCAEPADTPQIADRLLAKLLRLRIFSNDAGRMNRSVQDVAGGLLIVSQFTLAADTRSGNRPSFIQAAPPALARELYDYLLNAAQLAHQPHPVQAGSFGAHMEVALVNDGPVTVPLVVR
jgi:D-tyrosyl-tRNA(Tyr) deacylase